MSNSTYEKLICGNEADIYNYTSFLLAKRIREYYCYVFYFVGVQFYGCQDS